MPEIARECMHWQAPRASDEAGGLRLELPHRLHGAGPDFLGITWGGASCLGEVHGPEGLLAKTEWGVCI